MLHQSPCVRCADIKFADRFLVLKLQASYLHCTRRLIYEYRERFYLPIWLFTFPSSALNLNIHVQDEYGLLLPGGSVAGVAH